MKIVFIDYDHLIKIKYDLFWARFFVQFVKSLSFMKYNELFYSLEPITI